MEREKNFSPKEIKQKLPTWIRKRNYPLPSKGQIAYLLNARFKWGTYQAQTPGILGILPENSVPWSVIIEVCYVPVFFFFFFLSGFRWDKDGCVSTRTRAGEGTCDPTQLFRF